MNALIRRVVVAAVVSCGAFVYVAAQPIHYSRDLFKARMSRVKATVVDSLTVVGNAQKPHSGDSMTVSDDDGTETRSAAGSDISTGAGDFSFLFMPSLKYSDSESYSSRYASTTRDGLNSYYSSSSDNRSFNRNYSLVAEYAWVPGSNINMGVEDSYRMVLGRHLLIGVRWNFGKMNAAQSGKAEQAAIGIIAL